MSVTPERAKPCAAENLFQLYSAAPGVFDEMETAAATPRAHWRDLVAALEQLGRHELTSRWDNGRRIIREHGVTYNIYGDPRGMDRPWGLDLIPLLIAAADWARAEAGLIQRSRLFNLILADIYAGGQRLLRNGFLPPELIYANPGFLRPCRGIAAVKNVFLHLHACDLARSPDGSWWVLADRTQAPSGAGYALENRTVISRILPEEIRDHRVRRLAHFFRVEREMLFALAPAARDQPNVVLLTPGPHNETYFEHAYLARHLGFPLVEGADLTVRDRRVFLKTLEGLQPVDVILRRVDDSFCDPLELRGESFLGVAGLVEATRAGNVTVANALGSGLLECPAFLAFLPSLCRHLLGEELLLPSVATWWCGQGKEQRFVTEHLDELVVKPAFGPPSRQPWFGGRLSHAERAQLLAMIRARPQDFVGQERVVLSRAPVWVENRFEARSVVLRAYVANGGEALAVMPGGLTRVSTTAEDPVVSMQSGGGSKDTWVLGAEAARKFETAAVGLETRATERASFGLPSRAADNLFWLGRYTERLEQTLRTLRCVLGRLSDEGAREGSPELCAVGELMRHLEMPPTPARPGPGVLELQPQVLQLVYKANLPGSVPELLGRIRFTAATVRDRFSGDTWRILGRLDTDARTRPGRLPLASALAMIHNLVLDLAAFNGMEMENMTRGPGWRFLDAGRRLERAFSVVNLLRAALLVEPSSAAVLEAVLEIADSVMTYRRRYFAEARLPGVLELLLRDETNPRSFAFQIQLLREHIRELPQAPGTTQATPPAGKPIASLTSLIEQASFEAVVVSGAVGNCGAIVKLLGSLADDLTTFSHDVTSHYFAHTMPRVS